MEAPGRGEVGARLMGGAPEDDDADWCEDEEMEAREAGTGTGIGRAGRIGGVGWGKVSVA